MAFNFFVKNEKFFGNILIVSHIKMFEVECECISLMSVMDKLQITIIDQIEMWKKDRFKIA